MRRLLVPVVFVVMFSSCGDAEPSGVAPADQRVIGCSEVATDDIRQDYTVVWDEDDAVGFARAEFRLGHGTGSFVELDGDCRVTFNGMSMSKMGDDPVYYDVTLPSFAPQGTFVFTGSGGATYTNSIGVVPFSWDAPPEVDLSGMAISYAPDVAADEEVHFRARPTGGDVLIDPNRVDVGGTTNPLLVPADAMGALTTPTANIWMVRVTDGELQERTANERGEIDYEWRTAVDRDVPVVPAP